jgi:hypothetical protein
VIKGIEENRFSAPGQPLYRRFKAAMENNPGCPFELAFHGTPAKNVAAILRDGLDPKRRGTSTGQAYGRGEYFGRDFQTSLTYCRGEARMLVFVCLLTKKGVTHKSSTMLVINAVDHQLPLFSIEFARGKVDGATAVFMDYDGDPGKGKVKVMLTLHE